MIETERLRLIPFEASDAPVIERLLNDKEIASNTRSVDYPYPAGQAAIWIEIHSSKMEQGKSFVFGIRLKETDALIGGIGLEVNHDDHRAEIGYWMGREFWNRGFATEAVLAMLEFGFETVGLHRIFAHCLTRNPASTRVLEKAGLEREGILRGHARKWGVFEDVVVYGAIGHQWLMSKGGREIR